MRYLLSVIDDGVDSATEAEMIAIGTVNDGLRSAGYLVFADGLAEPHAAMIIDNRTATPSTRPGPLHDTDEFISGFWIISVPDTETAHAVTADASRACNRRIELRPFFPEG